MKRYYTYFMISLLQLVVETACAETICWNSATIDKTGENIVINEDDILSIVGTNIITTDALELKDGATLEVHITPDAQTILYLDANLDTGSLSVDVFRDGLTQGVKYSIITLSDENKYDNTKWNKNNITLTGEATSFYDLSWNEGSLVYYYRSNYEKGSFEYKDMTDCIQNVQDFTDYVSVRVEGNDVSSDVGLLKISDSLNFCNNGSILFSGNQAEGEYIARGGVLYSSGDITLSFSNNGAISFSENKASSSGNAYGGAINMASENSILSFTKNDNILFSGNVVENTSTGYMKCYGGAIYGYTIDFENNKNICFSNNKAVCLDTDKAYGGAINVRKSLTFNNNENIRFEGNYATSYGGAISMPRESSLNFTNNGSIVFSQNSSAIYADAATRIYFTDNDEVLFSGNKIHSVSQSKIFFEGNNKLVFTKSSTAISVFNGALTMQGNESVLFTGNGSSITKALYAGYRSSVTISNNDSVVFQGNIASLGSYYDSAYLLRSIYIPDEDSSDYSDYLILSNNEGQTISFFDSIYAGKYSIVQLNKNGSGNIVFSGETTIDDLQSVIDLDTGWDEKEKESSRRIPTEDEVMKSRTSNLLGRATLYGGNLIIKDDAILNISSFRVNGGNVTVESGAKLNLPKSDISMPLLTLAGGVVTLGTDTDHAATLTVTSLTISEESTLNADLVIADNGSITFDFGGSDTKNLTMGCSLTLGANTKVYIDHATIVMLDSYYSIDGITLVDDIEAIQDILLSDNVKIYDMSTGEEVEHLLYTKKDSNGTTKLMVTPEASTVTLFLLVIIGSVKRNRRP